LCHSGELGQAESDLAPLRQFGPPILDLVQPMPYPVVNTILDDAFPRGALNYWKSAFFTELSDGAVQTMIEAFEATPERRADEAISLDQLRMAARIHGMPSEILARDVTPIGLHYLPVHYDIPILELGKRI
jgi:hypothetical protein